MPKTITILLPTYNEEKAIGGTIKQVQNVSKEWKIVVVDSYSKDKTVEIAKSLGAEIVSVKERGKGKAVKVAFEQINSDYLIMLDADSTYSPNDIPAVIKALGTAEVVLGSRFAGKIEKGAMAGLNGFGNKFITKTAAVLYNTRITDVCTGMWGFTKKAYKTMDITAPHFELEVNFFIELKKKNLKMVEIPISYSARLGEKKLNVLHGLEIELFLLKHRFF